jgi:hypothetical protein
MSGQQRPSDAAAGAAVTPGAPTVPVPPGMEPKDVPVRPPLSPDIAQAHVALLAARVAFGEELDGLTASTQAALDIPAKIRRNPVKTAALAGGAGFLLLGGPKKMLKLAGRALPSRPRDPYAGLLPDEVERVLKDSQVARDPRVRMAIEKDFAEYLRRKGRTEPQPNARASLWRTYDALVGPLGTVGARMLVERLFQADQGARDRSAGGKGG